MSEPARGWDRRGISIGLLALAYVVRVVYLWQSRSSPTFGSPVVDAETYDRLARALVSGGGLNHEFFWQPVFYPLFLSAVYRVTGSSILLAKLLQCLVGAVTCVGTFHLGARLFGRRAGLAAGLLMAFYGPAIFFDGELLATGWAGLWSVALLLLFLRAPQGRGAAWLALGICGALATLTRPTFLPFFLLGCAWLWRAAGGEGRARRLALVFLGFLVIAAPVALTSRAHSGRLSLLPASAGLNLHIGNNPDAARTIAIRPGWDWKELTSSPRRHGVIERKDTGRFFRGQVVRYALGDPAGFLHGLLAKAGHLLCSRELPRNIDVYLFREHSALLRMLVWKAGGFGFPFGLLLPLAVAGVVLCYERLPAPVRWFLLLYPLAIVLVFVSARYRTPVVPVLAVVAAGGCFEVRRAVAARRWRRLGVAAAAALLGVVIGTLPGPYPQERADYRAELEYFLGTKAMNADDLESAARRLERAVELEPDHSDAHNHLGITYTRLRDRTRATHHFEEAVRSNPRSVTARTNLARLYAAAGRREEALVQFETALEQDPFDLDTHRHYGLTLLRLGRREEAVEHLRPVVESRPEDTEARRALARALAGTQ